MKILNFESVKKEILDEIKRGKSIGVENTANAVYKLVTSISPVDTGSLRRAIKKYKKGEEEFWIVSRTPRNPKHNYKLIPYHVIIHFDNTKRYSGDPKYMFTAERFVNENFSRIVEASLEFR